MPKIFVEPTEKQGSPRDIFRKISNFISAEFVTDLESADYLVASKMPFGLGEPDEIQKIIKSYETLGKKTLIFLHSDCSEQFMIPENVQLFRTSLYKSKKQNREHLLPYIWEGLSTPFEPLVLDQRIKVGFCGLPNLVRSSLLDTLKSTSNVETDFIIRDLFWGGKPQDPKLIYEFRENIRKNHFQMCNRGNGNFSMRFYQTLSAGRIPLITTLDMLLPLEEKIDWDKIIIKGNSNEEVIYRLEQIKDPAEIIDRQKKCSEIYFHYFEPNRFFQNLFLNYEL